MAAEARAPEAPPLQSALADVATRGVQDALFPSQTLQNQHTPASTGWILDEVLDGPFPVPQPIRAAAMIASNAAPRVEATAQMGPLSFKTTTQAPAEPADREISVSTHDGFVFENSALQLPSDIQLSDLSLPVVTNARKRRQAARRPRGTGGADAVAPPPLAAITDPAPTAYGITVESPAPEQRVTIKPKRRRSQPKVPRLSLSVQVKPSATDSAIPPPTTSTSVKPKRVPSTKKRKTNVQIGGSGAAASPTTSVASTLLSAQRLSAQATFSPAPEAYVDHTTNSSSSSSGEGDGDCHISAEVHAARRSHYLSLALASNAHGQQLDNNIQMEHDRNVRSRLFNGLCVGHIIRVCRCKNGNQSDIVRRRPELEDREGVVVDIPQYPCTWIGIRLTDGEQLKLRSSNFEVVDSERSGTLPVQTDRLRRSYIFNNLMPGRKISIQHHCRYAPPDGHFPVMATIAARPPSFPSTWITARIDADGTMVKVRTSQIVVLDAVQDTPAAMATDVVTSATSARAATALLSPSVSTFRLNGTHAIAHKSYSHPAAREQAAEAVAVSLAGHVATPAAEKPKAAEAPTAAATTAAIATAAPAPQARDGIEYVPFGAGSSSAVPCTEPAAVTDGGGAASSVPIQHTPAVVAAHTSHMTDDSSPPPAKRAPALALGGESGNVSKQAVQAAAAL